MRKPCLFREDDLHDALDGIVEIGIRAAHRSVNSATHFSHERFCCAEQMSMANSATQNLSQHVASPFVGGNYSIRNQKRRCACVIGNDPKRSVTSLRCAGTSPGEFSGAFDEWHEQIRIEIADLALEDGSEAFETSSGVDRWLWKRSDRARGI